MQLLCRALLGAMAALMVASPSFSSARAESHAEEPTSVTLSFVDKSRPIKATMGFAGSETRRIDVTVWHDGKNSDEARPLILYSHGTFGSADNALHFIRHLVANGYVVAAPDYPLTSRAAWTKVRFADISDVVEQTRDVRFILDQLLAHPEIGPMIDADAIGATGHSLGGVTNYFTSFGAQTRDPRIKAVAPIGAGDPVQSAFSSAMGLAGTAHAPVSVPVLFLSAEKDIFARTTGRPYAAYSRLESPKYELMIKGGVHIWFRDGDTVLVDNKNPDCLFFEENMPDIKMPGCEERVPLIGPQKQQAITRDALLNFFDAYLKNDGEALERLKQIGERHPEAALRFEDIAQ